MSFRFSALAFLLLAACGDRVEPVQYPVLALQEELRIKNPSEQGPSSQITGAAMDRYGSLYLMDAGMRRILVFDSTGKFLHNIGRGGEQPGEFSMLGSLGVIGDTVWLADPRLGRVTLFSRDGKLITTLDNSEEIPVASPATYSLLGLLPNGARLVAVGAGPGSNADARVGRNIPFVRVAADNKVDTLFHLPVPPSFSVGTGRYTTFVTQPFDERPTIGVRRDGGAWVVVERAAGESGPAAATVTRYTLDSGKEWTVTVPLTPERISRHVRDSIVDEATGLPDKAKELREWLHIPKRYPLVTAAMLSDDGTVWLNESTRSSTARWIKLDPTGKPMGALLLKRSAQILYATADRLWMMERDESDTPHIVRFRVHSRAY